MPAAPRAGPIADRTRARHADVHRLLAEGRSLCQTAATLGLSRNTVRRFARAASPEELLVNDGTGRRVSILDEHEAYLRERWNSGCTNAAQLWQEIHDRGYTGGRTHVRHYLARNRGAAATPAPSPVPPKVMAVTSWIMTSPDNLDDAGRASLDSVLAASPELAAVTASVRAFAAIMNERRGRKLLEPWMNAALATGEPALRSFVTGLRADQDAVTNGLSLPWSSGAVEGHVNRIILWNQNCQVLRAWIWRRTSTTGRKVALAGGSSCRGVGPAGVGMSASRSSSRSRAALPSSTAACSSSVSGIIARIFCRFSLASRSWALPESFGV